MKEERKKKLTPLSDPNGNFQSFCNYLIIEQGLKKYESLSTFLALFLLLSLFLFIYLFLVALY